MIVYSSEWDLSTIPYAALASELGRRNFSRRTTTNVKLAPCRKCGKLLSASDRRHCPNCGYDERSKTPPAAYRHRSRSSATQSRAASPGSDTQR